MKIHTRYQIVKSVGPVIEAAIVAVIVALLIFTGVFIAAEADCLEAGYPKAKFGGTTAYCIKRVNQTDVVVPLSVVKEQAK